jgi:hypothetical protein
MSSKKELILLYCLFSLASISFAKGRARESFQHFFGDVKAEITTVLAQNCSSELESYRKEDVTLYGTWCVKTYSCVAEHLSGYTSANMAASGVLLGLTPWILSTLGSSTIEMSLLSSRRPVLAFLLVLGSPALLPTKPFEEYNPIEKVLTGKQGQWTPSPLLGPNARRLVMLEFFLAAGCIGNLAQLSWTLALNTISTMSCDDSDTLVELWIALAIIAHFLGIITFFSRAEIKVSEREKHSHFRRARHWYGLLREGRLCVNQEHLDFTWGNENLKFAIWSWLAAVYTVAHLTFGTAVLSSLSFVGEYSQTPSSEFQQCEENLVLIIIQVSPMLPTSLLGSLFLRSCVVV